MFDIYIHIGIRGKTHIKRIVLNVYNISLWKYEPSSEENGIQKDENNSNTLQPNFRN